MTEKEFERRVKRKHLKGEIMEHCECANWARDSILLLTKHHPICPKYNVEAEANDNLIANREKAFDCFPPRIVQAKSVPDADVSSERHAFR